MIYKSTKIIDGFSTCFRQWRAIHSHCQYLHGYSISFKLNFTGELDEKNWVQDFGFLKSSKLDNMNLKDWFNYYFDHTTIFAKDDPQLNSFIDLDNKKIIQLRILDSVGCEKFAEFVFNKISLLNDNRVELSSVECFENNKNSAIYENR